MPLDYLFKILVLGQSKVGKTSFVQRYVRGVFNEGYKVTIGGQEDTLPLTRAFFKNAHACIIMFDLTNAQSLQYCTLLKQAVDSENTSDDCLTIPCVLVGNKCDLPNHSVSVKDMDDFTSTMNCITWKNTSVKENKNIEETVWCIVEAIMERQPSEETFPLTRMELQNETYELEPGTKERAQRTLLQSCCSTGT
ncbi:ras-related protein Rab-7L1-like isoform X2 [Scleropages formosus]|uniref:Ras-related protein Rab-7L1-like n=1 Tax=Scleropages formosus TaxID=113540 RepID=A0A8C9RK01_SCLFO|nr:ras-related protein Rab-7L1-like isoform X2 [Scleropages formosus]